MSYHKFFCIPTDSHPIDRFWNRAWIDSELQDHYVTIHVTPEPEFSYVSFETNQDLWDLYKQANKVLECFKSVLLLLFSHFNFRSKYLSILCASKCKVQNISFG